MIKITNLKFSYNKKAPLQLDNVSLTIDKGMYISIIGENGSCKTTLVKLILGLLQPNSGTINNSFSRLSYVPQKLDSFNSQFPITIREILKTHGKAIGVNKDDDILSTLDNVNLSSYKDNLIGSLSGGQQQRVYIARALIGNPDLIILDEPSTALDTKSQQEIYSLLSKLNTKKHKTILSIEHNISQALKYSTHIIEVKDGNAILYSKDDFLLSRESLIGF
ncbi:MAG: metal ABC transporter ATP-binding protein [Clostridium sp.]